MKRCVAIRLRAGIPPAIGTAARSMFQAFVPARRPPSILRRASSGRIASILLLLGLADSGCGRGNQSSLGAPAVITDSLLQRTASSEFRLLRFRDDRGTVHEGWLRLVPDPHRPGFQPVLILGGIGTGR